jgi:hypothetical protein
MALAIALITCNRINEVVQQLHKRCEVVSHSSQTVSIVTALVQEDERGGQDHTSKSLLHQSAM